MKGSSKLTIRFLALIAAGLLIGFHPTILTQYYSHRIKDNDSYFLESVVEPGNRYRKIALENFLNTPKGKKGLFKQFLIASKQFDPKKMKRLFNIPEGDLAIRNGQPLFLISDSGGLANLSSIVNPEPPKQKLEKLSDYAGTIQNSLFISPTHQILVPAVYRNENEAQMVSFLVKKDHPSKLEDKEFLDKVKKVTQVFEIEPEFIEKIIGN